MWGGNCKLFFLLFLCARFFEQSGQKVEDENKNYIGELGIFQFQFQILEEAINFPDRRGCSNVYIILQTIVWMRHQYIVTTFLRYQENQFRLLCSIWTVKSKFRYCNDLLQGELIPQNLYIHLVHRRLSFRFRCLPCGADVNQT